jgi:hypothetical protein
MQEVVYEEVDGRAIISTDAEDEWIESDSVILTEEWV